MKMSFAQCEGAEQAEDVDATDVVSLLASLIDQVRLFRFLLVCS